MPEDHDLHIASLVIHGGQEPDPVTGAVMPPISLSSTYAQRSPGEHTGYVYARGHNPTRYALERCIAKLEGSGLTAEQDRTFGGFAFASGLAATDIVLHLLQPGDKIVAMDDMYGGTYRLMTGVCERSRGLDVHYLDLTDTGRLEDLIDEKTKLVWVETPTNPQLKVVDLKAVAEVARRRGALAVCDNTFATPILQRPLEHGFDIVVHSATKYLGGHSDVIAGLIVTGRPEIAERLRFLQNAVGTILGPFEAYMTLRGIKTLAVRMRQHCRSAEAIAPWLEQHEKVDRVAYPCLPSHPHHDVAMRQMSLDGAATGGGMITMWLDSDLAGARRFLERVRIFTLAESLGGVESLIEHPAIMTHASVPPETREKLGISDTLVRLSVGIEDFGDLRADLEQALAAV